VTDPGEELPAFPDWSKSGGPDVFTLRAWLAAERAMEQGQPLDDTVTFMQDRIAAIFGRNALLRFGPFLEEQGIADLGVLLADEAALESLRDFLLDDDDAPDNPFDGEYGWVAERPGRPRRRLKRAARDRRRNAALAYFLPERARRVAGNRSR
jgi:hypothetical protein